MGRTIADRILAVKEARKMVRDAILSRREGAKEAVAAEKPPSGDLLSRFQEEVVPSIGQTVSTEVASALERVRSELIQCLERQLSQLSPVTQVIPQTDEIQVESLDTDLDLPAEEVNRQIDKVFAEFDAPAEKALFERAVPISSGAQIGTSEENELSGIAGALEELNVIEPTEIGHGSAIAEALGLRSLHPEPTEKPEPFDPLPLEESSPESSQVMSLLETEIREAIIPGIADGISRILENLEKSQERIVQEMALLSQRVKGLEEMSIERHSSKESSPAAPEEPGSKTIPEAAPASESSEHSPEPRPLPEEGMPAISPEGSKVKEQAVPPAPLQVAPGKAADAQRLEPSAPAPEPTQTPSPPEPGSYLAILQCLQGMECRILEKIDSVRPRRKKSRDLEKMAVAP